MNNDITGVIIAGGKSQRMQGKNKGLQSLAGKPLCKYLIDAMKPTVDHLFINSNDTEADYRWSNSPIIGDQLNGYLGPLAGIHSGLNACKTEWLLTTSVDTPFIKTEVFEKLVSHRLNNDADCYYAVDNERAHPLFLLIHKNKLKEIERFLKRGDRKVMLFLNQINAKAVDFSDKKSQFININTDIELAYWNQQLTGNSYL